MQRENAGVDSSGGKCRSKSYGTPTRDYIEKTSSYFVGLVLILLTAPLTTRSAVQGQYSVTELVRYFRLLLSVLAESTEASKGSGFNPTRSTPPRYNNTTRSMRNKHEINKHK